MLKPKLAPGRIVIHQAARPTLILLALAAATFSAGLACLWYHHQLEAREIVLAPAGLVLLISGAVQLRIALLAWRNGRIAAGNPLRTPRFWRLFLLGAFSTYGVVLMVGPIAYVASAWLAGAVVWYTFLLLPLAVSPQAIKSWRQWFEGHRVRRYERIAAVSVLLLLGAEISLRMVNIVERQGWFAASLQRPVLARAAEQLGPAPDTSEVDVERLSSDRFRLAVLGDEAALRRARVGCLGRVQESLPGVAIMAVGLPAPWSSAPGGDLAARLSDFRPDLVLAVVSVCEDLTEPSTTASYFDWRELAVVQPFRGQKTAPARARTPGGDFEAFLRELAPQLAACRTPIDEPMRARWQQTFASLDRLLGGCQRQHFPVALVVIPSEFQVNRGLCETLGRRLGYTSEQLDVELPQRRLVGFAEHRRLPVLDLLPYLRLCRQSPYEPNAAAWNEQGNAAAASAISGWLESRYGGQLAVAAQLSSAP